MRRNVIDHDDDQVSDDRVVMEERHDRAVTAHPWSPAQVVAVVIGAAFVILGIAALARTGIPTDHLDRPQEEIIGFRHSPLLGMIEIGFGALLIVAGVVPGAVRSLMALLGVVAAGFGVILLVDVAPDRLHRWLGVGDPYGWMVLIVGVVLLAAAFFSPDVARNRHRRQRVVS
jgi:hypothetical protein